MQFLREPALFPARLAGEPWGTGRATLTLAGEAFGVAGASDAQLESLGARYGSRLVTDAAVRPRMTLEIFRAPASDFVEIDTRGWEYWLDLEWSVDALAIAGMRLMARLDFSSGRGAIWTSVDDVEEFWGIVENVLRPLLAASLLRDGGLLVHSTGAGGLLFPGASGDGKSTIASLSLSAGVAVLSDDLNAVVRTASGFVLMPLPFSGELREHELATDPQPLRAVVGLHKGAMESLAPLTLAAATALIVSAAPYVNQNPGMASQLLDRAAEIASGIPRATLTFRRDGNVWPILESLR